MQAVAAVALEQLLVVAQEAQVAAVQEQILRQKMERLVQQILAVAAVAHLQLVMRPEQVVLVAQGLLFCLYLLQVTQEL
jgi:hypothetical protein